MAYTGCPQMNRTGLNGYGFISNQLVDILLINGSD